jgi:LPXTG-site transpeptidase (sortase) family protein
MPRYNRFASQLLPAQKHGNADPDAHKAHILLYNCENGSRYRKRPGALAYMRSRQKVHPALQGEIAYRDRWLVLLSILAFVIGWIFLGSKIVSRAADMEGEDILPQASQKLIDRQELAFNTSRNRALLQASPDLSIVKEHSGDFEIGADHTYTITVANVGTAPAAGPITVTDILTSAFTPGSVQGSGWDPCDFSNQTLTCVYSNTAELSPNQSLPPISMTVNLGPVNTPLVTNTATVSNTNDLNLDNNVVQDTAIVASADLIVSKTITPTTPAENEVISYSIVVTNTGPADAGSVVLTDTLPVGVTYASSQPSQGTYNQLTGIWAVGDLANNASVNLTINGSVNPNTRGTVIVNTTNGLTSSVSDPDEDNNVDSVSFEVLTTRVLGNITDAVTDDPIEDALLTLSDSGGNVYTTTTVASGLYTFTSTITEPLTTGAASLVAAKEDYASETRTFTIVASSDNRQDFSLDTSDLVVDKDDGRTQVIPGQTVNYTLGITNAGTLPAANIVITDELSANMTYITDTLGITHTEPSDDVIVWELEDDLNPGEGITFTLQAQVDTALPSTITVLTNQMEASTESLEANKENNVAEDSDKSTGSVNISITKSVNPTQFRVGDNSTFTIRVVNNGSAPATDLVIRDNFSSYLDIINASSNRGDTTTNSTTRRVTVEISSLDPDESATITVRVRANSRVTSDRTETNTATIEYKFGGDDFNRDSNTVSYRLLRSTTLPGTGLAPIASDGVGSASLLIMVSAVGAAILAISGIWALIYGLLIREKKPEWGRWSIRMGILLTAVGLVFGLLSWVVRDTQFKGALGIASYPPEARREIKTTPTSRVNVTGEDYSWPSEPASNNLAVLPEYPVPTPTIKPTPDENGKSPDISAITRIVIPVLQVDAVVKYVPFDGLTWKTNGLRHEVAWMGDTSWPGLGGNTVLAGHVTLRGGEEGPFRYLELLQPGDQILVYTEENMYTYQVGGKQVVEESDLSVVEPTGNSQITLITCTGWDEDFELYLKRLVVNADLVERNVLARRAQEF